MELPYADELYSVTVLFGAHLDGQDLIASTMAVWDLARGEVVPSIDTDGGCGALALAGPASAQSSLPAATVVSCRCGIWPGSTRSTVRSPGLWAGLAGGSISTQTGRMHIVVANRGEIAVRVMRTARERGYRTLAMYAVGEQAALHVRLADDAVELPGTGQGAYHGVGSMIGAAEQAGAGALVHPGVGFLSESAEFAAACAKAGFVFVGPAPEVLRIFGDKIAARETAGAAGVAVLPATAAGADVATIAALLAENPGGVMVKAAVGGGGRGMRVVRDPERIAEAIKECQAEASYSYFDDVVYAEALAPAARHIEVQVVADGVGAIALGDRDCSVQRRHQKLVEIAPAPNLGAAVRDQLHSDAVRIAESVGCRGVITVEFLVAGEQAWFLEVNPRLQVEHTITEECTGVDLVGVQFDLAQGAALADLALPGDAPHGYAVQARVNAELLTATGDLFPATGTLTHFAPPTGTGVRVDTGAYPGMRQDARFDSLLAKVIARGPSYPAALRRCSDALGETAIGGIETNLTVVRAVLDELHALDQQPTPDQQRAPDQPAPDQQPTPGQLQVLDQQPTPAKPAPDQQPAPSQPAPGQQPAPDQQPVLDQEPAPDQRPVSVAIDTTWFERNLTQILTRAGEYVSPVHVEQVAGATPDVALRPDEQAVHSPMGATVVSLAEPGTVVAAGAEVAVLEAMKMQHAVRAQRSLRVVRHLVAPGDTVDPNAPLVTWVEAEHNGAVADIEAVHPDSIRADLAEVRERHRMGLDKARGEAVAKRHRLGRRTARENIEDLVDYDSFVEYGALAVAAQRLRRSPEDLIANTPADGLITGIATVNADLFGAKRSRAVIMSYDYTVLAGTQGMRNHTKSDRMLELAHEQRLPVVFFTEGGGGRPGDTDYPGISGLDVTTFRAMGALSGRVPLIGIVSGRCFAGNAALLGMCDVVIATPDANIGMGGPAMIEGGGLGVFAPEDIGPIEVQRRNGVVHIVAADEAEAVALAQRYLAYFQGVAQDWAAPDPRMARHIVPENRLRAFDIRAAIESVTDVDSVLELRRDWGVGVVTALVRFEGLPFGLIANDCHHLGGAIDAPAADKLSMFLRLCDAHGLPIISLCDTPGFMVGPEAEKHATVTKFSRLFIDSAALSVPFGTVILRKGYGLGAQAMAAGSFRAPRFVIAWPTGEIGGMGLEGAVRLGFAKELAAIEDPDKQREAFDNLVQLAYAQGKALTAATVLELDDVIDPADTRRWIRTLR